MTPRWLITGAGGMLGSTLVAVLRTGRHEVVPLDRARLDLRDPAAVRPAVRELRPDVVVNCAGWTAVDDAEIHEEEALAVNGDAVRILAEACGEVGARLVQPSTDYVFDGTGRRPYAEDAPTAPLNAYGRTKLAGEQAVLKTLPDSGYVVRTAWLYGATGGNFVRTMIRLAGERPTVDVVDDQFGQPTWTDDLAHQIIRMIGAGAPPGVYHGTSSASTSWHGLAREVFTLLGADPDRVRPVASAAFPRPAPRPAFGVLGHAAWSRAGLAPIRHWRDALHAAWPSLVA
ncbi:dTDP-4-dehydrorhamnose reductase [Microbispora triticiradicis]|uniref:dTDP-4-dehydrorhamnose reductase n=1 Tax=Microbispora triticiradicis TaxID=2200763 RepID=A0ABX9LM34_9ACTN|nr:dTDP-4-dehydrorhamnose reductase [Microbispora triticiradicis]RGA04139.1 dTDP-4-dehydrorhamnose reductase [Microbispora triticiradicis]GLW23546.1 NAD(P)-dependent oxidoreductase [Microbispora amethystogenes]